MVDNKLDFRKKTPKVSNVTNIIEQYIIFFRDS